MRAKEQRNNEGVRVSITSFFSGIDVPLNNHMWSWGAWNKDVIVLRAWADQYDVRALTVDVLYVETLLKSGSSGLGERVRHLKAIWGGGVAADAVLATAEDPTTDDRKIKSFRDVLFPIEGIDVDEEGTIFVRLVKQIVTAQAFARHRTVHRTKGGSGDFPVADSQVADLSSASFHKKIPHIRERLIQVAKNGATVFYGEILERFAINFRTIYAALSAVGKACSAADEPIITALVINKQTGRCSAGLEKEFGITDDAAERGRCYTYWRDEQLNDEPPPAEQSTEIGSSGTSDYGRDASVPGGAEDRLARFLLVQARPEQPGFRRAVFEAYDGRCAVSGCDIPEALEAAHLLGRDWREGHNRAGDGILLRRDLHTLYDRQLLNFSDGVVRFSDQVAHYYGDLEGTAVSGGGSEN
jgi:hypothetical protein